MKANLFSTNLLLDLSNITDILNYAFIGLFALVILFFLIALFIGSKRGVWSATFRLIFMLVLIGISILSLNWFTDLVGTFPVGQFLPFKTVAITNSATSATEYVPITSLRETVQGGVEAFFRLFNVKTSGAGITEYAFALTNMILKYVAFIVSMLLIVTLGNLFAYLLWHLFFKKAIPLITRKRVKGKFAGALINGVKYVVCLALFLSPFTSLINAFNQGFQYTKQDEYKSELVDNISGYLDSYNDSIFAQAFFNWTVNDDGLSFDAALMSELTSTAVQDGSLSLIREVENIGEMAGALAGVLGEGNSIDIAYIASEQTISAIFDGLENSNIITYALPLVATIALNSDFLANTIDARYINMEEIDWVEELDNIEGMVNDLISTGIVNSFVDANGNLNAGEGFNVASILEEITKPNNFNRVIHAIERIDNSKLLSRAIPAVMEMLKNSNPSLAQWLPNSWDKIYSTKWGYEFSIILDCTYRITQVAPDFLDSLLSGGSGEAQGEPTSSDPSSSDPTSSDPSSTDPSDPPVKGAEAETSDILNVVFENIGDLLPILVGEVDFEGNSINVDNQVGRTIVYNNNGERISGRNYCLFDSSLIYNYLPTLTNLLVGLLGSAMTDEQKTQVDADLKAVMSSLNTGAYMSNYKKDFYAMFKMIAVLCGDLGMEGITGLTNLDFSDLGSESNSKMFASMKKSLPYLDKSRILNTMLVPMLEGLLCGDSVKQMLGNVGINGDIMSEGFKVCKERNILGKELAKFIGSLGSCGAVLGALGGDASSTGAMLSALAENGNDIVIMLDTFKESLIINPDVEVTLDDTENPGSTITYPTDTNFYNILTYIFNGQMQIPGLSFDLTLDEVKQIKWTNSKDAEGNLLTDIFGNPVYDGENGYIVNVISVIAETKLLDNVDEFNSSSMTCSDMAKLETGSVAGQDAHAVSKTLAAVGQSEVFKSMMGGYLDNMVGDKIGVDASKGVSFENVTNWAKEGMTLRNLLLSMNDFNLDLGNLDMTNITEESYPVLNNILHNLYESQIFGGQNVKADKFTNWLYEKLSSSLTNVNNVNLIADPSSTNANWESEGWLTSINSTLGTTLTKADINKEGETQYIAQADFINAGRGVGTTSGEGWSAGEAFFESDTSVVDKDLDELSALINVLVKLSKLDLDSSKLDAQAIADVLNALNNTTCFRMVLVNIWNVAKSSANTDFVDLNGVNNEYLVTCNAGDGSLFEYEDARLERGVATIASDHIAMTGELDCIANIVSALNDMNAVSADKNRDISKVGALADIIGKYDAANDVSVPTNNLSETILYRLINCMYSSKMFHTLTKNYIDRTVALNSSSYDEVLATIDDSKLSVFESLIYNLIKNSGFIETTFSSISGAANQEKAMAQNIAAISLTEVYNSSSTLQEVKTKIANSSKHLARGYHTASTGSWIDTNTSVSEQRDEVSNLLRVFKVTSNLCLESAGLNPGDEASYSLAVDMNAFNLNSLAPDKAAEFLFKMSYLDTLADQVNTTAGGSIAHFLEAGLDSIGLKDMSKFNGESTINFELTQKDIAGNSEISDAAFANGSFENSMEDCEVKYIYNVLNNMKLEYDSSYTVQSTDPLYGELSDMNGFLNGKTTPGGDPMTKAKDNINGIFYLLSDSKMFSSKTFENNGFVVKANGATMFNMLKDAGIGSYISSYDGSDDAKMETMTRLFSSEVMESSNTEAKALFKLMKMSDSITGANFDDAADSASKFNAMNSQKALILELFDIAIETEGYRSYIASDIFGGVFESLLTGQSAYSSCKYNDKNFVLVDLNETFNDHAVIGRNSFDNICERERNGLDGIISVVNAIVATDYNEAATQFTKVSTATEDSHIAEILFLSQDSCSALVTLYVTVYSGTTYSYRQHDVSSTNPNFASYGQTLMGAFSA